MEQDLSTFVVFRVTHSKREGWRHASTLWLCNLLSKETPVSLNIEHLLPSDDYVY